MSYNITKKGKLSLYPHSEFYYNQINKLLCFKILSVYNILAVIIDFLKAPLLKTILFIRTSPGFCPILIWMKGLTSTSFIHAH